MVFFEVEKTAKTMEPTVSNSRVEHYDVEKVKQMKAVGAICADSFGALTYSMSQTEGAMRTVMAYHNKGKEHS